MQEWRYIRVTSHSAWEKVSTTALLPRISQWMLVLAVIPVTGVLYTHNQPWKCLSPQFTDEHTEVQGSVNKPAPKHVPGKATKQISKLLFSPFIPPSIDHLYLLHLQGTLLIGILRVTNLSDLTE